MLLLVLAAAAAAMPVLADGRQFPLSEGYANFDDLRTPGIAKLELTIGADGRLARCDVVGSSGSGGLDRKACAAQRVRRFQPARDADGAPVAALLEHSFVVRMPYNPVPPVDLAVPVDRLPPSATNPFVTLWLVTEIDGPVSQCVVRHSSGNRQLDDLACATFRRETLKPVRSADGTPLRAIREINAGFVVGGAAAR